MVQMDTYNEEDIETLKEFIIRYFTSENKRKYTSGASMISANFGNFLQLAFNLKKILGGEN